MFDNTHQLLFFVSCCLFTTGGVILATTHLEWFSWSLMTSAAIVWMAALYKGLK